MRRKFRKALEELENSKRRFQLLRNAGQQIFTLDAGMKSILEAVEVEIAKMLSEVPKAIQVHYSHVTSIYSSPFMFVSLFEFDFHNSQLVMALTAAADEEDLQTLHLETFPIEISLQLSKRFFFVENSPTTLKALVF